MHGPYGLILSPPGLFPKALLLYAIQPALSREIPLTIAGLLNNRRVVSSALAPSQYLSRRGSVRSCRTDLLLGSSRICLVADDRRGFPRRPIELGSRPSAP